MDFSEEQASGVQSNALPQFSELASRSNAIGASVSAEYTSGGNMQSQAVQTLAYTTAANMNQKSMNSPNKYTGPMFAWPRDPSTLFQLCEKQSLQTTINIPNYGQSSTILGMQANNLSASILSSMYLPSTSQVEMIKQEINAQSEQQRNLDIESQTQSVAEYLQKWQATTLPATLQQIIKLQTEQAKKEKTEEEKTEHPQNSILNIPTVPVLRNTHLQNGSTFMNADQMMIAINPSDLNVHLENEQEDESNMQPLVKEQQIQTDSPKIERKPKFRAKIGEIKVSLSIDGSTLYCCPECSLVFSDKADIDQHIQAHIQERKYQCKECGAMLKRKEHLDQHMRGHSNERPYKCSECEKAFKRHEHLTRHSVIHSGNKNYLCEVCQKAFSRKDHLNKHAQTHSGTRKNKSKKDSFYIDQKDFFDAKSSDASMIPKQEVNYILRDGCLLKQETTFLHHIQNLQKDSNLLHTFSSFKEQAIRDSLLQQQSVNTNEILPQNAKYLMPS